MQLSWLHGRPKKHKDDTKPKARVEQFAEGTYHRRMPDIGGCEYLVNHWHECGMFSSGMNGAEPLTWQELQSYSTMTSSNLEPWESKQIIKMSRAYVSFKHKADEMNCIAPYRPEMTDEDRIQQANALMMEMDKLKNM